METMEEDKKEEEKNSHQWEYPTKTSKERLEDPETLPEETDALGSEEEEADLPWAENHISLPKIGPLIVVPSSGHEIRTPTPEDEELKEQRQSVETSPTSEILVGDNLFEAGREDGKSLGTRDDERGPASTEKLSEARAEEGGPGLVEQESAKSISLEPSKTRSTSRTGSTTPVLGSEKSKMSLRSQEPPSDSEITSLETGMGTSQKESETSRTQTTASSATPFQEEDSIVLSAFPGMLFEEKTQPLSDHPLSLSWVFGYNSQLPVFNLLDEDQQVLLYVSAHTAVIHDILKNQQYLLQDSSPHHLRQSPQRRSQRHHPFSRLQVPGYRWSRRGAENFSLEVDHAGHQASLQCGNLASIWIPELH
ncbi:cilia- and flagella-associated protein 251 [Crotalus tigris]|uniref:cilia- and flagella-associated protein 251 n=1 Tax=Crotalus tigris TaxID=88082 RepID=UPI00192FA46E|nr:cilia- and flagella-associated protein 251 [Crotalus tigris]